MQNFYVRDLVVVQNLLGMWGIFTSQKENTTKHAYTYTYKYIHIKERSYEVRKRTRAKSLGLKEKW